MDHLRALVRKRLPIDFDGDVVVPVRVAFGPQMDDRAEVEDLLAAVDGVLHGLPGTAHRRFEQGRVLCYQCASLSCEHSAPPNEYVTFMRYIASGRPVWESPVNIALEKGWKELASLLSTREESVAFVLLEGDLMGDLLEVVAQASNSRPLWQVTLVPSSRLGLPLEVMSYQLSVTHGRHANLRLVVLGDALERVSQIRDGSGYASRIFGVFMKARRRVRRLQWRAVRQPDPKGFVRESALPMARWLQSELLSAVTQHKSKTAHAMDRYMSGKRPVGSALADILACPAERFFMDTHRDTVAVVGPRGRVHVLTREGKLVTSMVLDRSELQRRQTRGRFRPLAPGEAEALRARVRTMAGLDAGGGQGAKETGKGDV